MLQGVVTNLPPTHCAKPPLTQAFSPSEQPLLALRDWNFLFNACACCPFDKVKEARLWHNQSSHCASVIRLKNLRLELASLNPALRTRTGNTRCSVLFGITCDAERLPSQRQARKGLA